MAKNLQPMDIVPSRLQQEMNSLRSSAKPWLPHPYQQTGIKSMLSNAQFGLLLDPGLGKTSTTLAAIKIRMQKRHVRRTLVVAPLRSVYEVWPQEVCGWADFKHMNVVTLHGPHKDAILRALEPHHHIVLMNPEGFAWLIEKKERIDLLDAQMLVIDESSKWKNSQSVRFKSLRKVIHRFTYRAILTGSPRPRNYEDLWSQIFILDRGVALGPYITSYRQKYFYPTGFMQREWALLPDKEEEINALVAPMVLRLDAEDYLKLPQQPERTHEVVMPDKAKAEYDAIEDSMLSQLLTAPITSSAGKRAKCCQLANGAMYVDPTPDDSINSFTRERKWTEVHSAKVDALVDLVEELQGQQILISIGYHHDVDRIRKALKREVPCINGKTTTKQASEFLKEWNAGELAELMVHPASAGHGINAQRSSCRHVAFFDIPDDYDNFDQTYKRVRRQGNQAQFVMKHFFVCKGTVDVVKMRNLKRKGVGQKSFLDAMRKYAEEKLGGKSEEGKWRKL